MKGMVVEGVKGLLKAVNQWPKPPNHKQLPNAPRVRNLTAPKGGLLQIFLFLKCSHHIGFGRHWRKYSLMNRMRHLEGTHRFVPRDDEGLQPRPVGSITIPLQLVSQK